MCERTFSGALGPYFAQIKEIAAGGNGRILSGIDTRFDFPVCIKRISVANKDECRAALREIRIRRRLRHENIVGLLNAIVLDGTEISAITPANFRETSCIFLVQELLDADLRQVIESQTRLSDDYVKLFFYQLLRGMKYIHSANVLHQDLKPSNVMINVNSLQLMIGDFGHSMVLDPKYSHGNSVTVCDTSLWYKAPELILGTAQYSTASDIWAVGCVLAEMLLGRPLFEGENDLEQLELIIHAIEVPPKDQSYIRSFLTDEVNTMYSGKPKFPLQTKFQKVDFQALHLLEHLLAFNPEDRVTIELALSHPFLQEFACVADEPVCLKPLHLEHEVDDFLEYTLKDLIVGECVSLAEEQPRIHLQMSSYSSLTDISKDCHVSPSESISHSMEERSSLELKTVSEDHDEEVSSESEGNRFKVLEVLKEEHGSSSDSNGLATHEEGVSEAPMVLDHPMFSSSKWEKERHIKSLGHRRRDHHHHRRKKKHHLKSPSSEIEPSLDSNNGRLPEIRVSGANIPGIHVPKLNTPEVEEHPPESTKVPPEATATKAQDDNVHELIMRSRQLIADQNTVMNEVPAITDICCSVASNSCPTDVCSSLPCKSPMTCDSLSTKPSINDVCCAVSSNYAPADVCEFVALKECPVVTMETEEEKRDSKIVKNISSSVGDLSVLTRSTVDLGVAEVVRRSQELLGDVYRSSTAEDEIDPVQDLISRSEQLLTSKEVGLVQSMNTAERRPCASEEKNLAAGEIDPVQDLISRSEQLLTSKEVGLVQSMNTAERRPCASEEKNLAADEIDSVQDLISRSEQLLTSKEVGLVQSMNTAERRPCASEEKNLAAGEIDPVQDLISRSEQLLTSEEIRELNVVQCEEKSSMHASDSVKDLISKSEQLLKYNKSTQRLQPVNKQGIVKHCGPEDKSYNYPPPFTDKSVDLTIQPPPVNHLANNPNIHSSAKENASWVNSINQPQPVKYIFQPMLSDPYHLKASDRRMQELLEESHTLVSSLETDQIPGKIPSEEKCEEFSPKKRIEKGNFDEGLDGIDFNEMKQVLDQAKKLLEKSNELCAKESSEVDRPEDAMDVDELVNDASTGVISSITADFYQRENTTKDVVKDFSCFQNQVDVVTAQSLATNEQAAMYEVNLIPPKGSTVSTECKSTNTRKQVLVKKRSHETVSETSDDNAHKNFKNSTMTSPDVDLSTAICDAVVDTLYKGIGAEQSRKHCSEHTGTKPRLNGFNADSLDLNIDERLIEDSNYKIDFKNQVDFKPGKNSLKHEIVTRRNTDPYSPVIEHINSDEVVDKLCGNTCRIESNTNRLNSKDSAGLQNFYAALKIQSIMRSRTRPRREMRHDTYPF